MFQSIFFSLVLLAIHISIGETFAPSNAVVKRGEVSLFGTSEKNDNAAATENIPHIEDLGNVGFVLLAGGTGSRMKANMPKQFLELKGMPVLHHSLDLFLNRLPAVCEQAGVKGPPIVGIWFSEPKILSLNTNLVVDKYVRTSRICKPWH
jgi:4-diphosphocytidyl-2-methyl-D-erithritol synthase